MHPGMTSLVSGAADRLSTRTEALEESSTLTRRQALQAGSVTAAAAFLLLHPWVSSAAAAAERSGDLPGYLLRSSYRDLVGTDFAVAGTTLRLESVDDLSAASNVASLRDSEDAFSLVFSGPGVGSLPNGIERLDHPDLGTFDLYVGHVGAPGQNRVEVVVNRVLSNKESRRTPPRPQTSSAAERRPTQPAPAEGHRKPPIRHVKTTRTKRGLNCSVEFASGDVRSLTAWLQRGDRFVATAERTVRGHRLRFNVKSPRRLRKGSYVLILIAIDAAGEQTSLRKSLTLR
jgi:hypothetical protein